MTISCSECPAFATSVTSDGRSLGMCGNNSQVVYLAGTSPVNHLEDLATACPDYGDAPTTTPSWFSLVEPQMDGSMPRATLGSCRGCTNFVTDNDSSVPDGISLCGATGSMIDPDSSFNGCPFANEGIPQADAKPLNAVITSAVAITANPKARSKIVAKARANSVASDIVDPSEYPTDLPVEDEDAEMIRAWRAIEVGEGNKRRTAYLPIFRRSYFSEDDRRLIPVTGDHNQPELYHDGSNLLESFMIDGYLNDEAVCLVGEPGSGKTELARHIAWLMQAPFFHIQYTEDTLPDEVIGKTEYHPEKGTFFARGILPNAIDGPSVVLSDEPNTAQDSILQQYRSVTSSSRTLLLDGETDPARRVLVKHDYCVHLLALNPVWDPRNLGVREFADADVSRLSFIWVEEPPADVIGSIILSKLAASGLSVSDEDLANMLAVREDIKELAKSGALPFSWSIRQDVKVAKKLAYYSPVTAYRRALLDYCHPEAAEAVVKAVQSVFGF